MAKKFQLSIPEPCHEDWEKMHPVEKGRFCDSCQKKVVDFSNMSDFEIAQFFKKPYTGSLCGRFMNDQLERTIELPKKRIPWLKYFFQIAIPAFLTANKAAAQGSVKVISRNEISCTKDSLQRSMVFGDVMPANQGKQMIKGRVLSEEGRPIQGASVIIKGTITGVATNANGEYFINASIGQTLVVSFVGFETQHILVSKENSATVVLTNLQIASSGEVMILTGMMVRHKPIKTRTEINGVVVDESGNTVPFATISVNDFKKTVMADEEGKFSINPKKKWDRTELIISSVGYEERRMFVRADDAMEDSVYVELTAKDILKEVTIISYGTVRGKVALGGAVAVRRQQTSLVDTIKNFFMKPTMPPKIYPNPVQAGAAVHIAVDGQEDGMYVFELLNANGQSVQKRELWVDKEARVLNVDIPDVTGGAYFLRMMSKQSGKAFTEKIVIQ